MKMPVRKLQGQMAEKWLNSEAYSEAYSTASGKLLHPVFVDEYVARIACALRCAETESKGVHATRTRHAFRSSLIQHSCTRKFHARSTREGA